MFEAGSYLVICIALFKLINYLNNIHIEQKLKEGICIEGSVQVSKLSASRPADWASCVTIARLKFEKYFNHKVRITTFLVSICSGFFVVLCNKWFCACKTGEIRSYVFFCLKSDWHIQLCKPWGRHFQIRLIKVYLYLYICFQAKHLLHAFPMDTKLKDGSKFVTKMFKIGAERFMIFHRFFLIAQLCLWIILALMTWPHYIISVLWPDPRSVVFRTKTSRKSRRSAPFRG